MYKHILLIFTLLVSLTGTSVAQFVINPDDRDDYIHKAGQLFKENKWDTGKEVVDQGLKKYPKDSDLRGLNGKYLLQIKKYDDARYELIKALEYNSKNVSAKQSLVNVEMATERYSSAISYVNELLEVVPYDKTLWLKKAEAYRAQGNIVESNRLLKRIRHIYPEDKTLKENLIDFLIEEFQDKKDDASISEIEELALYIINESPKNEDVFLILINRYIQAGDYEKALLYAERGVLNMPNNITLIKKKNSILAHQSRYQEILSSLKEVILKHGNTASLQKEHDYYLEEAALHSRKTDTYHLYQTLFQKEPGNTEYFNQVYTIGLSKSLYDDVIEAIKLAKGAKGETRELLNKELYLYERMGNQSKYRQLVYHISELYPNDEDTKYEKSVLSYREAKDYMSDRLFQKAIPHLNYVEENGDENLAKQALISKFTCFVELGKMESGELVINQMITLEPQEADWRFKKSHLLGINKRYIESLVEYEAGLQLAKEHDGDIKGLLIGYEDQATAYTKTLIDTYRFDEAIILIDRWLITQPESEMAVRYGYNVASQMNNLERVERYLAHGVQHHPQEVFFQLKLADSYVSEKRYDDASMILRSLLEKYPYHKEAISTYSELTLNQIKLLLKESKAIECLEVANQALIYNPQNNDIKYMKGVAYEKMHMLDSAAYYQDFNKLSLTEQKDHERHMKYLNYTKKKNEVSFFWNRYRFADLDIITSVAGAEYSRIEKNDTYTGRVFYSGRDNGKGFMVQGEWGHKLTSQWSGLINASVGRKVFPKFSINPTLYYAFVPTWEAEFGLEFRKLPDSKNLFNQQFGFSKGYHFARFSGKFNSVIMNNKWYYNVSGQTRFFIRDQRNYVFAVGGIGSAPEIETSDNQLNGVFDATNAMVGFGAHIILSEMCSIDPMGTWYNYKVDNSLYRNIYMLQLKLNIRF